jgi:hypothetical protein
MLDLRSPHQPTNLSAAWTLTVLLLVPPGVAALAASPQAPSRQSSAAPAANPHNFRIGQRIEGWITAEWLPVTLVQIGGGPWADSPYLVEYGTPIRGIQPKRWLSARDVRPLAKTPPDTSAAGPRLGRYVILSYGTPSNPLRLGEIELVAGGAYRYYANGGRVLGAGTYRFDATKRAVVWQDGILKEQGWTGTFTVERNGKTHQIRLMRTTIAVNSVD